MCKIKFYFEQDFGQYCWAHASLFNLKKNNKKQSAVKLIKSGTLQLVSNKNNAFPVLQVSQ